MTTDADIQTPAASPSTTETSTEINPPVALKAPQIQLTAAEEAPVLETARIIVPRDDLPDEAFAAVKRGDVLKLKSLLDQGLDPAAKDAEGISLLDRAVSRFDVLRNAVSQNETEDQQKELVDKVDPEGRADAGLAALILASANGNVDVAQMVLDDMEDDELDDDDDDLAEEIALEHGNMSVFLAIQARKQRNDFNKSAADPDADDRDPTPGDAKNIHDGTFEWFLQSTHHLGETIAEDYHKLANSFHRASHATAVVTEKLMESALQFCSQFLHINLTGSGKGGPAATEDAIPPEVQQSVTQIGNALKQFDPGKKM